MRGVCSLECVWTGARVGHYNAAMTNTVKMLRVPLALMVVAALSACGVKSSPKEVDGSVYPRIYPAPADSVSPVPAARQGTTTGTVYTRRPAKDENGFYQPPPPATEMRPR